MPPIPSSLLYITEGFPYTLVDTTDPPLEHSGPLVAKEWEESLSSHPDRIYAKTLVLIIKHGVRVGYTGPHRFLLQHPHPSALQAPDILAADLEKQCSHNRLTQIPYQPNSPFISSPLGLVPKANGGYRRIHDLSCPRGQSVNDGILHEYGGLEYVAFNDAVDALLERGQGATLVKKDLSEAFRHIPIAQPDWWLLGFYCQESYWIDRFLPFGLRTAPYIFDLFAKGLHWILIAELGWYIVLHYLDDFFAVLKTSEDGEAFSRSFNDVATRLGFSVNVKKDVTGTTVEFLGIILDSIAMEARLPQEKLDRARHSVSRLLQSRVFPLKELQKLVGHLAFAARVMPTGRAFLRRLYDAMATKRRIIRKTEAMNLDLRWWHTYLQSWNGSRLLRKVESRREVFIWTDAAGQHGIGGYRLDHPSQIHDVHHAFSIPHHSRRRRKDIQYKEMQALLYALRSWLSYLKGCNVYCHIDNDADLNGLRKMSMKGPAMAPLRDIAMLTAQNDILLQPRWVASKDNELADDLSRFHFEKIANKYPYIQIDRGLSCTSHPPGGTIAST